MLADLCHFHFSSRGYNASFRIARCVLFSRIFSSFRVMCCLFTISLSIFNFFWWRVVFSAFPPFRVVFFPHVFILSGHRYFVFYHFAQYFQSFRIARIMLFRLFAIRVLIFWFCLLYRNLITRKEKMAQLGHHIHPYVPT